MICINCNKETKNPKFCSRSCAATHNNKILGYRGVKSKHYCLICNKEIKIRRKYCKDCHRDIFRVDFTKIKLSDLDYLSTYQKHAKIRGYAKYYYNMSGVCDICGYDIHTELCHIKPISSFDDNSLLSDINNIDNLMELCPNCHWEFDNNILTQSDLNR